MPEMYDIAIIGGGIAGLTAGIYAVRGGWKTIVVEKMSVGGQLPAIGHIENYPGFETISGYDLAKRIEDQALKAGVQIEYDEVQRIESNGFSKIVVCKKKQYSVKAVIIASGSNPKKLEVRGEKAFWNNGVHYCALCDGPLYKNRKIAVVGGGDAAVSESVFLANIASEITVIHRRDFFRAEKVNQGKFFSNKKIKVLWNTIVEEILGDSKVKKLKLKNIQTGKSFELEIDALFVYIGLQPNTAFVNVEKESNGLIKVNEVMETSVNGIFAAGDCCNRGIQQFTTAVGEAAIAAIKAGEYIEKIKSVEQK